MMIAGPLATLSTLLGMLPVPPIVGPLLRTLHMALRGVLGELRTLLKILLSRYWLVT